MLVPLADPQFDMNEKNSRHLALPATLPSTRELACSSISFKVTKSDRRLNTNLELLLKDSMRRVALGCKQQEAAVKMT
jgi:hypothetical protein